MPRPSPPWTASTACGSGISTSAVSLGIPGEFDNPKFTKAIDKVIAAARKHGKALGRLVPTVEQGIELYTAPASISSATPAMSGCCITRWPRRSPSSAPPQEEGLSDGQGAVPRRAVGRFQEARWLAHLPGFRYLAAAESAPGVELPVSRARRRDPLRADQVADVDALILLTPRFAKNSIHPNGRLAVVARFGVGYDNVDVPACTDAGIAASHHARWRAPAGRRLHPHLYPGARPAS